MLVREEDLEKGSKSWFWIWLKADVYTYNFFSFTFLAWMVSPSVPSQRAQKLPWQGKRVRPGKVQAWVSQGVGDPIAAPLHCSLNPGKIKTKGKKGTASASQHMLTILLVQPTQWQNSSHFSNLISSINTLPIFFHPHAA